MTHATYIISKVSVYELRDVSRLGKQDPYCVFQLGDGSVKTSVDKRAGVEASWDENLELSGTGNELIVKCYNKNTLFKDGLVGEAVVPLRRETAAMGSGSSAAPSRVQLQDPQGNPAGTVTFHLRQQGGAGAMGDRDQQGTAGVTGGLGRVNLDKDIHRHHMGTAAGVGALGGTGLAAHEAHAAGTPGHDMAGYSTAGDSTRTGGITGGQMGTYDQGQHHHHHHGAEAGIAGGALGAGVVGNEARPGHSTTAYDSSSYATGDATRTGGIMRAGDDYSDTRDQGHHHHHDGTETVAAGGALGTGVAAHAAHKHLAQDRTGTHHHTTTGVGSGAPTSAYNTAGYTAGDDNAAGRNMGGQYGERDYTTGIVPGPGEHRDVTQTGTGYNTGYDNFTTRDRQTTPGLIHGETIPGRGQHGFGPGTDQTGHTSRDSGGTRGRTQDAGYPMRGTVTGTGLDAGTMTEPMVGGQNIANRGQGGFGPGRPAATTTAVSERAEKRQEEANQPSILEQAKASIATAFDSAKGKVVGTSDRSADTTTA